MVLKINSMLWKDKEKNCHSYEDQIYYNLFSPFTIHFSIEEIYNTQKSINTDQNAGKNNTYSENILYIYIWLVYFLFKIKKK